MKNKPIWIGGITGLIIGILLSFTPAVLLVMIGLVIIGFGVWGNNSITGVRIIFSILCLIIGILIGCLIQKLRK